jgi:hypothetical protein
MKYEWLTEDQISELVNPVLKGRGYAELGFAGQCECGRPLPTARVLGAFLDSGELIETFTLQMMPFLGPLLKHDANLRDSGEVSRQMVAIMYDFLISVKARDFLVIANSPVSRRLCERFSMKKVECPVFMTHPGGASDDGS